MKGYYITSRVLAILLIAFISLFALDVFDVSYGFWMTFLALAIHLIPSFILAGALAMSWKRERGYFGGAVFVFMGVALFVAARLKLMVLPVSVPLLVLGCWFIILAALKDKQSNKPVRAAKPS